MWNRPRKLAVQMDEIGTIHPSEIGSSALRSPVRLEASRNLLSSASGTHGLYFDHAGTGTRCSASNMRGHLSRSVELGRMEEVVERCHEGPQSLNDSERCADTRR